MKKIVIIGGGIAGLSAGVFAQMNGFESVILEKNANCGGECIGWTREGCYIDGCIHWLTGTKEGTQLNDLWKSVGALECVDIVKLPHLYIYRHGDVEITISRDIAKFKQNLLDVAPEDSGLIDEFMLYLGSMQSMEMPIEKPMDMMNVIDFIKLGKKMGKVAKISGILSKMSIEEFAGRCNSEVLKGFLLSYMPKEYSLMSFIVSITSFLSGNADIPNIKSMEFSEKIRDKYLSLGGKILYRKSVKGLQIENKMITKATCADGSEYLADYFIPSCDMDITYHKLLENKYNDKQIEMRYANEAANPIIANCYFAYSLDTELAKKLPEFKIIKCEKFTVANKEVSVVGLKNYTYFDNGNGLTTLISPLMQDGKDYEYWKELYKDREAYNREKSRIGNEIMQRFIGQYPFINGKIKLIDTATPVTYNRYLGAYKGAYMAFMLTKESKQLMHHGRVKGIKNCYLAGQWLITPGGLPAALASGKFAIQRICKSKFTIKK